MTNETTGYTIEIDGLIPYPEKLYVESGVFVRSSHLQSLRKTKIRELLGIQSNDGDFDSYDDEHYVLINGKNNAWEYFSKIIERPYPKFEETNVEPTFDYKPGDIFRADLTFYLSDHEDYNTEIYGQSKYWKDQWGNRTNELRKIINMFKQACRSNGYNVDITNVYYLLSQTEELSNLQVLRSGNYQTVENSFNYTYKNGNTERIVRNYIQHIRIYFKILDFDDDSIKTDGYKITQGFNGEGGRDGLATDINADRHFYWANYGSTLFPWPIKSANDESKMEVKIGYDDVNDYLSTNDQAFVYSLTSDNSNIYEKIETKRIDINGKNGESFYKVTDPDDIYDNDGTKYLDRGVFDFFCTCTDENSGAIFAEFSSYQVTFDAGATPFPSNPIKEESWVDEIDGSKYVKWHFSNLIFGPEDSQVDNKYQKEIYAYCPEGDLDSNIHYAGAGKMTVSMEGQNIGRYNLNVMDTLRRYGH